MPPVPDLPHSFLRLGVALAVGVLVGLQREFAAEKDKHQGEVAAGIRTFSLMGLLGAAAAMAGGLMGSALPFVAAFLLMGGFLAINYHLDAAQGRVGLTTKAACLLTMLCGGLSWWGQEAVAVAVGVTMTALLSVKFELHRFTSTLARADILAVLKFAVITAIILPVLPNKPLIDTPPFDTLVPFKLWLFVVLISGIGFSGYFLVKWLGAQRGIGLTGLVGGLASSTAVTVSFTERSRQEKDLSSAFALAITVAWTVMFARVLGVVAVLNWPLAARLAVPLVVSAAGGLLWCAWLWRAQGRAAAGHEVRTANPFELGPALTFGLLFTVILLISRGAHLWLGEKGVYLSSFVAGMADVDAIAYSMAKLDHIAAEVATRAILLSTLANTLLKGGFVLSAGAPELRRAMLPGFLIMSAIAAAFAVL